MRLSLAGCIMLSLSLHAAFFYLIFSVPIDSAAGRTSHSFVVSLISEGQITAKILRPVPESRPVDGANMSGAPLNSDPTEDKTSDRRGNESKHSGSNKTAIIAVDHEEPALAEADEISESKHSTDAADSKAPLDLETPGSLALSVKPGSEEQLDAVEDDAAGYIKEWEGFGLNMPGPGLEGPKWLEGMWAPGSGQMELAETPATPAPMTAVPIEADYMPDLEALAAYESQWRDFSMNQPSLGSRTQSAEGISERAIGHVPAKAADVDMPDVVSGGDAVIGPLASYPPSEPAVGGAGNDYINPEEIAAGNPGYGDELEASGQGQIERSVLPVSAVGTELQLEDIPPESLLVDMEDTLSPEGDAEPDRSELDEIVSEGLMAGYDEGLELDEGEGSDILSPGGKGHTEIPEVAPGPAEGEHADIAEEDASHSGRYPSRLDARPPGEGSIAGRLGEMKDFAALELARLMDENAAEARQAEDASLEGEPEIQGSGVKSAVDYKKELALEDLRKRADDEMGRMLQASGAASQKKDQPQVRKMVIKRSVHFELSYPRTWEDATPGSKGGVETSSLPVAAAAQAISNSVASGESRQDILKADRRRADGYGGKAGAMTSSGLKAKEEGGQSRSGPDRVEHTLPHTGAGLAGWDGFGMNVPGNAPGTEKEYVKKVDTKPSELEDIGEEGSGHGAKAGADYADKGGKREPQKASAASGPPAAAFNKAEKTDEGLDLDFLLGFDVVIEAVFEGGGEGVSFRFFRRPYPGSERRGLVTRKNDAEDIYNVRNMDEGTDKKKVFWVERAERSVYAFVMASPDSRGRAVDLKVTLKGSGKRVKEYAGLNVRKDEPVVIKFLMPDAIFWDDEEYFTGSFENSNSITKFNSKTGFSWKESKEY